MPTSIVHRALISALALGKDGLTREEEERLEEVSALISASERRAMAAERDTVDRLVAQHLAARVDEEFDARISGVVKAGLFVQLPQYGADGFIPVSSLGDDYYIYDESAQALRGRDTGKGYRLADRVEVRLVEVAPLAGAMRFEMLSDPHPLPGGRQSFQKGQSADGRRAQPAAPGFRRQEKMMTEQIFGGEAHSGRPERHLGQAIRRGFTGHCPHCGEGRMFGAFTKTVERCEVCGEELSHHRADDLPAYLTVLVVGHLMVGGFLGAEAMFDLSTWQHLAIWAPLTVVLALALLQPFKGAVVGLQWALYMHGFGGEDDVIESHPEL